MKYQKRGKHRLNTFNTIDEYYYYYYFIEYIQNICICRFKTTTVDVFIYIFIPTINYSTWYLKYGGVDAGNRGSDSTMKI